MAKRYVDLVIDGHEDIAFKSLFLKQDFLLSAHESRLRTPPDVRNGGPTLGLPDLVKGNVRIVFATIWAPPCLPGVAAQPCYSTPTQAYELAMHQLDYYNGLASSGYVTLIKTREDLRSVIEVRDRVGLVLLMEGADPVLAPKNVGDWYLSGLRILAPSWRATRYAGGTQMPGPLTDAGRELMNELEKTRLILDVSHMTDEGLFEALDRFHGTAIASHSNCRAFVPTNRQLSDQMIRALVARDAVIGSVFTNSFLLDGWKLESGSRKSQVKLSHVVKHMQHICEIAGDSLHVAIGSDLDGGFGVESTPVELDTVSDLGKLGDSLSEAGFSKEEVRGVMHKNWLRVLEHTLPS